MQGKNTDINKGGFDKGCGDINRVIIDHLLPHK